MNGPHVKPERQLLVIGAGYTGLRLALRLLQWVHPGGALEEAEAHQTRQASTPLWRWQMAS